MVDEQFDRILKKTLEDFRISRGEKRVLKSILDELDADEQQLGFIRHRAFEIARDEVLGPEAKGAINWLEDIVKVLQPDTSRSGVPEVEAYFSPGDSCVQAITGLLRRATSGSVPPGTRRIRIVLEAEVGSGANDGYADNLSLVLESRSVGVIIGSARRRRAVIGRRGPFAPASWRAALRLDCPSLVRTRPRLP